MYNTYMSRLDTLDTNNPHNSDPDRSMQVVQEALLDWFVANRRDLPWRHTRDPYRVLVSEIMLQQTQVDRVLPKYTAFLQAFPTLEALAAAPTAEVIRLWSGLGYNRRAVNLQRTARAVLEQHGGVFPREVAALQVLPGIGPYTAGAVACFAFEQDVAFMDTNIRRAVRRIFVGPDTHASGIADAALLDLARIAVPSGKGWEWNQGIMELGATICTAAAPACWRCPVRAFCRAYAALQTADENIFATLDTDSTQAHVLQYPSLAAPNAPQAVPRRVAERREAPYAGSNRFFRGRVVAALRTLQPGATITLAELGPQVKDDYSEDDASWLLTMVEALARDGLAQIDEHQRVSLPS